MRVLRLESKVLRLIVRGRRLSGIQEKNFEGDEGKVEEDEIANDGREECSEGVEDHGLGYL